MNILFTLTKRNVKLFFKDKGMFFTSLVTPAILLVLYVTFLGNLYRDTFLSQIPASFQISDKIINGLVGGQLVSSILAVSCITVAFCSNFLMVQDKANGTAKDLTISPVKSHILSLSYYIATLISTILICASALIICLIYLTFAGWYLTFSHVILLFVDVFLLSFLGTAISSVINFFLSTQGQISAVGTIISAGYGFICGAYMPIYSFGDGLQKVVSLLPGTYGTSLLRNHAMQGVFSEMVNVGIPTDAVEQMKNSVDCNVFFFGNKVEISSMYIFISVTVIALVGIYIMLNALKSKKASK
ncbi:MAG: ABC transporter permease [Clostridia bacterium]|nr:ABC transporter permease [Clostridia bacterium]